MKLCMAIVPTSCSLSFHVAMAYSAGIPIPPLSFNTSYSCIYKAPTSSDSGEVEAIMHSNGILFLVGDWSVPEILHQEGDSAVSWFIPAQWKTSNSNSDNPSSQRPSFSVGYVCFNIHLSAFDQNRRYTAILPSIIEAVPLPTPLPSIRSVSCYMLS